MRTDHAGGRVAAAASQHALLGVPVMAAYGVIRESTGSRFRRGTWGCGCGDAACSRPGSHPIEGAAATTETEVTDLWTKHPSANLMIGGGGAVDLWRAPREIGTLAMRRMEDQRLAIWPPALRQPADRWLFCTSQLTEPPPRIHAHGSEVTRVPAGEFVLAPPSRTPIGRLYWEWAPTFPWSPLVPADVLLSALSSAAAALHEWEVVR